VSITCSEVGDTFSCFFGSSLFKNLVCHCSSFEENMFFIRFHAFLKKLIRVSFSTFDKDFSVSDKISGDMDLSRGKFSFVSITIFLNKK
jgi:hypothetical protein